MPETKLLRNALLQIEVPRRDTVKVTVAANHGNNRHDSESGLGRAEHWPDLTSTVSLRL
jgi:hypothetical protein